MRNYIHNLYIRFSKLDIDEEEEKGRYFYVTILLSRAVPDPFF